MADFVELLLRHGVEIHRSSAGFSSSKAHSYLDDGSASLTTGKSSAKQFPAGSYVIPLAQPQKRLIKALLEPEARLCDEFLKQVSERKERNEKLGRRAGREPYGFYDVTAWSLPLTFGIEAWWTEDRTANLSRVESAPKVQGGVEGGRANYGYLFHGDSNAGAKLLSQLLGRGHVILFADDPNFRLVWPRLTRLFLNAVFLAPSLR